MTDTMDNATTATIRDNVGGARDALTVRRVFGEPYEHNGAAAIPVARLAGGAGGGGGEGPNQTGKGFGTGFGLASSPVGMYQIRDGEVTWKPMVDVNQLVRGFQVLMGIVAVCVTLVLRRRR
jgi:uncharacterized spore protein YtfJ